MLEKTLGFRRSGICLQHFLILTRIELNLSTEVKDRLGEGQRGREESASPRRTGKGADLESGGLLDCVCTMGSRLQRKPVKGRNVLVTLGNQGGGS